MAKEKPKAKQESKVPIAALTQGMNPKELIGQKDNFVPAKVCGILSKVWPRRVSPPDAPEKWSFQDVQLEGGGGKVTATLRNRAEVPKEDVGKVLMLTGDMVLQFDDFKKTLTLLVSSGSRLAFVSDEKLPVTEAEKEPNEAKPETETPTPRTDPEEPTDPFGPAPLAAPPPVILPKGSPSPTQPMGTPFAELQKCYRQCANAYAEALAQGQKVREYWENKGHPMADQQFQVMVSSFYMRAEKCGLVGALPTKG